MAAPTATGGPPDPAAVKSRIITHMNADHQLSLRLYLQRYCHIPSGGTVQASMEDITNEHMILKSSFGRHVVPLDPPMESLMQARERLVAMHQDCLDELDLSDIVVDGYKLPTSVFQWALAGLVILITTSFPFRESLQPESGSVIYKIWSLDGRVPGLAQLSYILAPAVLWFIGLVHCGETLYLARTRLRKHWVETFSGIWWLWVGECMLVGFGAIQRVDAMVKAKESAKGGKAQH
ncbi:uncharacterized protein A1O9_09975 [Exophiala aquamarina CBS 119918]|uniref:DUF2470 domain-containing protein n=1 Tax=Exophiala aquamarina CBS 119918 TaxID=1182545 RepID=A0A072PF33_9EURO|nr:uncharacterized protein A1O9_09975 [Exophiala aquamarina CBS 119918]KEF54180.1 hypothetical protein A1O9_09975 [Exophiala aquamarina CBS 119918]